MSKESVSRAMGEVEKLFERYEFPSKLLSDVRKKMEQLPEHSFHVPFETEVRSQYVYGELGFTWDKAEGQHELARFALELGQHKDNRLESNIFPVMEGSEVSVTEAVNLMQGRAVYRPPLPGGEGRWMGLDPANQHLGVGTPEPIRSPLAVEKELERTPLGVSLTPEHRQTIMETLRKGNAYSFEFRDEGKVQQLTLAANPWENKLDLRDKKGNKIEWADLKQGQVVDQSLVQSGHRVKR